MEPEDLTILRDLAEFGGTTEYAFISTGQEKRLFDLNQRGLVNCVEKCGDFAEIHITDKGREYLKNRVENSNDSNRS